MGIKHNDKIIEGEIMNYKTYSTLTPEQKEEYDYRFKEPVSIGGYFMVMILFFFCFAMFLFSIYVLVTAPQAESYKISVLNLFAAMTNLMRAFIWSVIACAFIDLFRIAWRQYQYYSWKRREGIKLVR